MGATNKCNITSLVTQKVNELMYGIAPISEDAILENYAIYLGCSTVKIPVCKAPDDCSNETIVLICNLVIEEILHTATGTTHVFSVPPMDDIESYTWDYDTRIFTLASASDESSITLVVKGGIDMEYVVTPISVLAMAENGCIAIKTCYYTPNGMQCADDYMPCSNPRDLQVTNGNTCAIPKTLIVSLN